MRAPLARSRTRPAPSQYLFEFDALDLTVTPRTGQAPTFARTSAGSYVDSRGYVRVAPHSMPRFTCVAAADRVGLMLERATANLALASEDLADGARWTAAGGIGVAQVAGPGVAAQRLTDASGAAEGAVTQAVACGAGPRSLSLLWRAGTSAGTVVALGAEVRALVAPGVGGAPVVTVAAGLYLGAEPLADGWWRILLSTTVSLGAGAPVLTIAPAATLAGDVTLQGSVDVAAAQVEVAPTPSSYVRSLGGVAGTRAADSLRYPLGWLPRSLTVLAEWARPAWAALAAPVGYYRVVAGLGGTGQLLYDGDGGVVRAFSSNGIVSAYVDEPYPAGALGSVVRAAALFTASNLLTAKVALEGGGSGTSAPAAGALTAYAPATISLGSHPTLAGYELDGVLFAMRVRAGAWSVAAMRGR